MFSAFSLPDIADAVAAGLERAARRADREQAVAGIDVRDELELHPLLARALRRAGFGVHRERRFPADRSKRRESEGERCDLVLTPDRRPLGKPEADPTLFDDPAAVPLDEAFWLEVKVVAQFTEEGANASWSSQLLSTVRQDVSKLAKDPGILHAGLCIILFAADAAVVEHDLGIWQDRCLERGLPIMAPSRRGFPLTDRLGCRWCESAVYGVGNL